MNYGKLGQVTEWADYSRDILHFIDYFLPPLESSKADLPIELRPLAKRGDDEPRGFVRGRRIVGMGHSFGGAAMYVSSLLSPSTHI